MYNNTYNFWIRPLWRLQDTTCDRQWCANSVLLRSRTYIDNGMYTIYNVCIIILLCYKLKGIKIDTSVASITFCVINSDRYWTISLLNTFFLSVWSFFFQVHAKHNLWPDDKGLVVINFTSMTRTKHIRIHKQTVVFRRLSTEFFTFVLQLYIYIYILR